MVDDYEGYVIHPTYRLEDDGSGTRKPVVTLWGKLKDGRSFLVKKKYEPYFFIPSESREKAEGLLKPTVPVRIESSELLGLDNTPLERVTTIVPADVPGMREVLERENITCYEADIRFAYRAMMDWGVKSLLSIKGDGKKGSDCGYEFVDVVFEEPEVSSVTEEYDPVISTLSFDLESNKHTEEIYCISCYGFDSKGKVRTEKLIVSNTDVSDATTVANETELISEFSKVVREWDPDLITGWNVIDFDLKHMQSRAEKGGIRLKLARDGSDVRLRIQSSFFRESTANVTGRVVIDGIAALKGAFVKLDNFKLATAAEKFTDEKKLIETTGVEKYEEIIRLYKEDKKALLDYNMLDAKLAHKILENSGILELTLKRSLLTGMPPDRVNASIAGLDSLYLRELRARGRVAPSAGGFRSDSIGQGGFVMQPKPGIYNNVIVCDFKSLYPSLMRTFNIDPLAFVPEPSKDDDLIVAPNGANFRREMGIIPGILQRFWDARDKAKKAKDDLASFAIKIHMNSIYGVLASPNCRFFNRQIGNAITSFAQHFIKLTAEKVKEQGYDVIYGDTDSIFINLDVENYDDVKDIGNKIEKSVNEFLNTYVTSEYKVESFLQLEFEKSYVSFLMPKGRGSETGAKKRYAGLVRLPDGTEKITFTGLESVRRDWTDASKEFQHELYRRIFHKEEVAGYVKEYIDEVKEGKHDAKLVYRKALRKDVSEYTKTTPPHVKAARKLSVIESSIIEYVMTTDGPEVITAQKHGLDYDHYIEKQLKPIADSILSFYDTTFDELLEGTSQKSLFDY